MVWCGANSIAVSTRELSVRCLDLETNDNYLLTLDNPSDREHFICLDFSPQRSILCGGTSLGRVAIWKHAPSSELDPENAWKLQVVSLNRTQFLYCNSLKIKDAQQIDGRCHTAHPMGCRRYPPRSAHGQRNFLAQRTAGGKLNPRNLHVTNVRFF